jgi:hypothetical protein
MLRRGREVEEWVMGGVGRGDLYSRLVNVELAAVGVKVRLAGVG